MPQAERSKLCIYNRRTSCHHCSGYGVVSDYRGGDFNGAMECDECEGTGYLPARDEKGRFIK